MPGHTFIVLTSTPELVGPAAETASDVVETLVIAATAPGAERVRIMAEPPPTCRRALIRG